MNAYDEAGIISAGEPAAGTDPIAEQEMNRIAPDRVELLGMALAKRRDIWVAARAACGVEKRWREDTDQYLGRDGATRSNNLFDNVEQPRARDAKVQRSTVFVNITRPKTNAAEARLANMLYPVDDRCWGIKPTPNPHLMKMALEEAQRAEAEAAQMAQLPPPEMAGMPPEMAGMPPQMGAMPPQGVPPGMPPEMGLMGPPPMPPQQPMGMPPKAPPPEPGSARAELAEVNRRAKAMEDEIHDALIECDYNAQGRLMLHDCAVLGTGVLKGPIVVNRVARAWHPVGDNGTHVLELVQQARPASERVDPWNVYPDPSCGEDIHAGIGIFEKKTVTAKQLRELATQPGYLPKQIARALAKGPQTQEHQHDKDRERQQYAPPDQLYELWEYWGEFDPDDLRECGVEIPEDSIESVSGCVIMVGDVVIKSFLNPLETGDLPYDFLVWERAEGSCWGYGIPFLCRPAQKVLNAAWRAMMDNAGASVGPNVVLKPNLISPADGSWQITGRKVWNCLDDSVDVRQAFYFFDVPNRSAEFQQIIELAMLFADEESSVPKLAQGEQGQAPETVGGMTLLMNSANVVLTRMVKQYDDMVTKPHIRRYYDWMMAYSDKPEIKGDFQVDARGSSTLLIRDMQQQALLQFGSFQGSPVVGHMVNWKNWIKEVLKAQHLDITNLLKSDDEIAAAENAPPPPNPEEIKAETAIQVAQIRAQATLETAMAREQGENAYAATQQQMARDNYMAKLQELELKRELALLEYANKREMTLEQVKADLAKTAIMEETKRQLKAAELQLKANEGDKDRAAARSKPSKEK